MLCLAVVSIFRSSPELTDDVIYQVLVSKRIERRLAARLVEFLSVAYCRVILEPTGARFPDTFQRSRQDGTTVAPLPLASEQVWTAAHAQVSRLPFPHPIRTRIEKARLLPG